MFLIETLSDEIKMEGIREMLGYEESFMVANVGHSGGLTMLWKEAWATVVGHSTNFIDLEVHMEALGRWQLTAVADPKTSRGGANSIIN